MIKIGFFTLLCVFLFSCQSTTVEQSKDDAELVSTSEGESFTMENLCKVAKCRENRSLKFRTDSGIFEQTLPLYWPAAYKNKISLLPGDVLFIEAEETDDGLGNFKLVDKIVNPEKTIEFSFTQMDEKLDMMLSVKNPFSKDIKYHLDMIDFSGKPHKTSSCPVRANISVYEHWPHVIPELILTDMHFLEPNDVMSCVY